MGQVLDFLRNRVTGNQPTDEDELKKRALQATGNLATSGYEGIDRLPQVRQSQFAPEVTERSGVTEGLLGGGLGALAAMAVGGPAGLFALSGAKKGVEGARGKTADEQEAQRQFLFDQEQAMFGADDALSAEARGYDALLATEGRADISAKERLGIEGVLRNPDSYTPDSMTAFSESVAQGDPDFDLLKQAVPEGEQEAIQDGIAKNSAIDSAIVDLNAVISIAENNRDVLDGDRNQLNRVDNLEKGFFNYDEEGGRSINMAGSWVGGVNAQDVKMLKAVSQLRAYELADLATQAANFKPVSDATLRTVRAYTPSADQSADRIISNAQQRIEILNRDRVDVGGAQTQTQSDGQVPELPLDISPMIARPSAGDQYL